MQKVHNSADIGGPETLRCFSKGEGSSLMLARSFWGLGFSILSSSTLPQEGVTGMKEMMMKEGGCYVAVTCTMHPQADVKANGIT